MRVAEATLKQKPRRGRYVFVCALLALVLLDSVAFGRMAGLWNPAEVVPQSSVPGIFVPLTLRVFAYGKRQQGPSPSSSSMQARTGPSKSVSRPHR